MIQMKRNECLRLIRPSNRKINIIRYSESESKEHIEMKEKVCQKLLEEGKHFVTEAIFGNGMRADIVCLDDFRVIEIANTETEKSLVKKRIDYPRGLIIEVVRC